MSTSLGRQSSFLVIGLSIATVGAYAGFWILRSHQLSLVDPFNNPYTTYSTICLVAFASLWLFTLVVTLAKRTEVDAPSAVIAWLVIASGGLVIIRFVLGIVGFLNPSLGNLGGIGSNEPPAVWNRSQIEALSTSEKGVRAIGIGDDELVLIARRLKKLDYLFVNSESRITDEGVAALAGLSQLRQVVINYGSSLTDRSIETLAGLPNLRELMIDYGPLITDKSLAVLGTKKGLRILYLQGFPKLSATGIARLRAALPECKIGFEDPSMPLRRIDTEREPGVAPIGSD